MKKSRLSLLLAALPLSLCGCLPVFSSNTNYPTNDDDTEESSEKSAEEYLEPGVLDSIKESVVDVQFYNYEKSDNPCKTTGFFIDSNGTFLTGDCGGAYNIKITTSTGETRWVSKIYYYKEGSPYTICHVDNLQSKPVKFTDKVSNNEDIFAYGYIYSEWAEEKSLRRGPAILERSGQDDGFYDHYYENYKYVLTGIPFLGKSNGPIVFNSKGETLGILLLRYFNNSYYFPYEGFKDNLTVKNVDQDPLHYFYNVNEVTLTNMNITDYFTCTAKTADNPPVTTRNITINYNFFMKPGYWEKMYNPQNISISFDLGLNYAYCHKENQNLMYSDKAEENVSFTLDEENFIESQYGSISLYLEFNKVGSSTDYKMTERGSPYVFFTLCSGTFTFVELKS